MAIAVPPPRSIRRTHASAASARMSLHATLAPYFESASAMPLPMLGPVPVTSATLPSSEISIRSDLGGGAGRRLDPPAGDRVGIVERQHARVRPHAPVAVADLVRPVRILWV